MLFLIDGQSPLQLLICHEGLTSVTGNLETVEPETTEVAADRCCGKGGGDPQVRASKGPLET